MCFKTILYKTIIFLKRMDINNNVETYKVEQKYVLKDGTIKTCWVNKKKYPRKTKIYSDEEKQIVIDEYKIIKNYTITSRTLSQKKVLQISPYQVTKIIKEYEKNIAERVGDLQNTEVESHEDV